MVYLDTSAVVPLFVREPASEAVDDWLSSHDVPLLSSDWLKTEFASALAIKRWRGELSSRQGAAVWHDFEAFCASGVRLVPIERTTFVTAARLLLTPGSALRAGDALHLAAAIEAGAEAMATADEVLARHAETYGLAVVRFY